MNSDSAHDINEFRADLHCHSTFSDGTLSPEQLVSLAKERGLKGLVITDHDTVEAYPSVLKMAAAAGLSCITGVEFSAIHNGVNVHILGYSFSPQNSFIHELCQRHQQRRLQRNQAILERLAENEMPITDEELLAASDNVKGTIGRPHIALAMVKKGYVSDVAEAFRLYIGEDKPCYVRGNLFSVEETLSIIHQANGFALIAHPHLIKHSQIIPQLLSMNFDGLEGYYAKLPSIQNARWVKIAQKKNWIVTGGSDFHGDIKPTIGLGSSWTNEETFNFLKQRFEQNTQ